MGTLGPQAPNPHLGTLIRGTRIVAPCGTPCDSRHSACLFPAQRAASSGPPDPFFASRGQTLPGRSASSACAPSSIAPVTPAFMPSFGGTMYAAMPSGVIFCEPT